jgi:hypothetical protein
MLRLSLEIEIKSNQSISSINIFAAPDLLRPGIRERSRQRDAIDDLAN